MIDSNEIESNKDLEMKIRSAFPIQDPDQLFIDRLQQKLEDRIKNAEQLSEKKHTRWHEKIHLVLSPLAYGTIGLILLIALIWGIKTLIPRVEPIIGSQSTPSPVITPLASIEPTQPEGIETVIILPTQTGVVKVTINPPTLVKTPVPWPKVPITAENAGEITELARWGRGNIFTKAWAPNGNSFTVGSASGIYVYDTATLKEIKAIEPLDISSIAYSPDGTILATLGRFDNAITLWDIASGIVLKTLTGQKGHICNMGFSPNGQILAVATYEDSLRMWDVSSGQELRTLSETSLVDFAFSPDGTLLATAEQDKSTVKLWEVASGQELRIFTGDADSVFDVAFSPDGTMLASNYYSNARPDTNSESTIKLWDVTTGNELQTINDAIGVSFLPEGHTLVIDTKEGIKLWDITNGQVLRTLLVANMACDELSPNGKMLLCSSYSGDAIYLYDLATGKESGHLDWQTYNARSVAFSPDGTMVAIGSHSGLIKLLDADNGQEIRSLIGHTEWVNSLAFSPDGALLASLSSDETARLWDLTSGEQLYVIEEVKQFGWGNWGLPSVDFSPDGNILAYAGKSGQVKLWNIGNHVEMRPLGKQVDTNISGEVAAVAFSPDGKILASGYTIAGWFQSPHPITLWDPTNGQELRTLEYFSDLLPNQVSSLEFSPDGEMLAAGYWEGKITMWDVASGSELYTWSYPWGQDNPDEISSLAFSPGGDVLAIGCENTNIILFLGAASGKELVNLPSAAYVLAFSPDGKVLISNSFDGTVRLWGIAP